MQSYSLYDIIPHTKQSVGYFVGIFENTPDPNIDWPLRHDFYSLVWFTKGDGINVIDFNEYEISANRIFTINPTQIHNWKYSTDTCGYFLLIDAPNAKQLNIDFTNPFIDLKAEDIRFMDEIFKRMLSGNNQLSAIAYLLSLLQTSKNDVRKSDTTISELKKLISENIDKNLSINQYAEELNSSDQLLNQLCKHETGMSAKQLQLQLKITEAKRLLLYSFFNTSEIAFRLGFEDSSYFSRIFKKKTNFTPSHFGKST
ncbi:AraC family transcriptional regulator [Sphingobacterium hotanense]|uniref:Helix-turn-helix transcriptional regulator n=1 Tax=Sphingobacterium hotanense TaxID=649196 RepID=A0ABT7NKB1_9SPHI|nr:AraC family transcriptional regulator [Sphingobacterium hotanense]MDM1047664.1 helix-turn-helix transcriptional regulator [Sphingobacterium hotanense]